MRKTFRMVLRTGMAALLASGVVSASLPRAEAADGASRDIWNTAAFGRTAKLAEGKLTLKPDDAPWHNAQTIATPSLFFWNKEGVTVTLTLTFASSAAAGEGQKDVTAFVGLVNGGTSGALQSTDNVVGLFLGWNQKDKTTEVWLGRKESLSDKPNARGDQWGNVPKVAPPTHLKQEENTLTLTLRLDADAVSASIQGTDYAQSFPTTELTREVWERPSRLIVECRNSATGRGSLVVNSVNLRYPAPDATKFHCLDLRPFANMGFKDETAEDKQGGWTDQGGNDLRHMPMGRQSIRGLPFDILNPDANNGKSCVMLYSAKKDFFPQEVGPILIGGKTNSLIFLHSAAWAGKEGVPAARYRVTYEDGGTTDIPVVTGANINDWWSLRAPSKPDAVLALEVKSENSWRGLVGLYAYRWRNPAPERPIRSLTLVSTEGDPVAGVVAVTRVADDIGPLEEAVLKNAFAREAENDLRKNPPDKDKLPDCVVAREAKPFAQEAFSAAGSYSGGRGGIEAMLQPNFAKEVNAVGGILRYPYGLEISFAFWPYEVKDWFPTLVEKGGYYGSIQRWFYKGKDKPAPEVLTLQSMLAACKKQGVRLILQLNCSSMFDGKDFIYIKTLPEERMRKENPLENGTFSQANLDRIVANNATLVDYVLANDYKDTVAFWEMDNERWDMPGADYAATATAHVKMLRGKIPDAKTIVCLGGIDSYCPNMEGAHMAIWNKELLTALARLGMNSEIDFFAPHLYPFLSDKNAEITQNYLENWCIRNLYRDMDYASATIDAHGFTKAKLYVTEWGVQSDGVCCGEKYRNDLNTNMAAALAAAKTMMTIYSHPRVAGATLHPFTHASFFGRENNVPISLWGCQTLFFTEDGRQIGTPHLEAVKMFIAFTKEATLVPKKLELPHGVNVLCAADKDGEKYFVVNSTAATVPFPVKVITKRASLVSASVLDTSVKYGSFGDKEGDIKEIKPMDFTDAVLPPYSINVLR